MAFYMAGAEKLKSKILSDARQAAETNLTKARREAEEIVLKARAEAKTIHASLISKAELDANEREKRLISVAELEGRKEKLAVKQRLIDELFSLAIDAICEKPDAEYETLLVNMIADTAAGGEEIILCDGDMARLSGKFIHLVNNAMIDRGKPGDLTLSKETRPIKGGFILRLGHIEFNNSFEAVVKTQRDSFESLAVKMLFIA